MTSPRLDVAYEYVKDVVVRRIGDELVLVPIVRSVVDMQSIYTLNKVAAFVWEHIDGRRTIGTIVADVLSRFEIDRTTAERDVEELVEQLLAIGAIREATAETG